jgi:hypothetical protein
MICRYSAKSFIEIPPCAKKATFITELATTYLLFYVVNPFIRKQLAHGGISK